MKLTPVWINFGHGDRLYAVRLYYSPLASDTEQKLHKRGSLDLALQRQFIGVYNTDATGEDEPVFWPTQMIERAYIA